MKIEKFLVWITNKMLNYPDISFKTVKIFIDKFQDCLSNVQKERFSLQIQIIKEFSLKQISLDCFVHNEKIKLLDNELNNLKENDIPK